MNSKLILLIALTVTLLAVGCDSAKKAGGSNATAPTATK